MTMTNRELADLLMQRPDDRVEVWSQFDYCFGGWVGVEEDHVMYDDDVPGLTRIAIDIPFDQWGD